MSRFLIATWDGGGNTMPALNLGSRLVRRGHRVQVLAWPAMRARVAAAGLEFSAYPSLHSWGDRPDLDGQMDLLVESLNGEGTRRDVLAACRKFAADAVVVDCMLGAGFDAVHELGLPSAALVHVSYEQFMHEWGGHMMGRDVLAMVEPCGAVLALQPPGFDGPRELPARHEYVGAIVHPQPPGLDAELEAMLSTPGDPWVLVSLSTTAQAGQLEALGQVLAGLTGAPVRVLLTLGGGIEPRQLRLPANTLAVRYVSHERVLPHVAAVVSHGGMSTVATALAHGRPLVCAALGRDQGGNAARVAAAGAGLDVGPSGAGEAVRQVLADPTYRSAAERLARAARPLGGGRRATDLVEALAERSVGVASGI